MENSPNLKISSVESGKISAKVTEAIPIIVIDETAQEVAEKPSIDINRLQAPSESTDVNFSFESLLKKIELQRDEAIEDRDRLFKILERRSSEIARLENESKTVRQQLKTSIDEKCEALRNFEEIQHKVTVSDFKEKRLEQERTLMQNQMEMLSNDLTRNIQELQICRKESTLRVMMLEGKLHEKSEELKISTMHESQLRESNDRLSNNVEELSKEILKLNENFSTSIKKYQQELSSKSRLVDLYKEKCEDTVTEQKHITSVVSDMREALKDATDEYGKLEMKFKETVVTHQNEIAELAKVIECLQNELKNANDLIQAIKHENMQISVEKLYPSAMSNKGQSKSGHSITEVYSMYVNASEDLDELSLEHDRLKEKFSQVVHEIEEKAPEIHRIQLKLRNLHEANKSLTAEYKALKEERLDTQKRIEMLMAEINKSNKKFKEVQQENKDLSFQVCQLLHVIEGKPIARSVGNDFSISFKNIQELQDNNAKLICLVRDLSAAIDEMDKTKSGSDLVNSSDLKISMIETRSSQVDKEMSQKLQQSEENQTNLKVKLEKKQEVIEKLSTQLDEAKGQVSELSATNFKLRAEVEHKEGSLKLQQKNFDITKRKLQSLDDKNRNSVTTITKLETSIAHLRDELQTCSLKLSKSEISLVNLTKENKNLIKIEAQLIAENEILKKQQQMQSRMMSSIESIKLMLERQDNSSKLSEMTEKCELLEKMLADEKKYFDEFESQANATIEELESESARLNDELTIANDEIDRRSKKIEEMTKRIITIGESDESESDTEMAKLKEKVEQLKKHEKSYKRDYEELKSEFDSLKIENENLTKRNENLVAENLKLNESSLKNLLSKARGMISKLSKENEKLKKQKEEIESQDFVSCSGSVADISSIKSAKHLSQKRQRDEGDEEIDEGDKISMEMESQIIFEKRPKIEAEEVVQTEKNGNDEIVRIENRSDVEIVEENPSENEMKAEENHANIEEVFKVGIQSEQDETIETLDLKVHES